MMSEVISALKKMKQGTEKRVGWITFMCVIRSLMGLHSLRVSWGGTRGSSLEWGGDMDD